MNATQLFKIPLVRTTLFKEWWPQTVEMASSVIRVECEENLKKLNSQAKKKPALKQDCFDFWKMIMEFHILERATNIELDSLIDTLLSLLQDSRRLHEEYGNLDIWHSSLGLVNAILNYYQTMNEFSLDLVKFTSNFSLRLLIWIAL